MQKAVDELLHFSQACYTDYGLGGLRVSIYVAYWQPGRMPHRLIAGHTPDVCWVGGGWECLARRTELVPTAAPRGHTLTMEGRAYSLREQTEYVVFCHLVGGKAVSYDTGREPPWYASIADLFTRGLQQRDEQCFVRISSNRPLPEFISTPPVRLFLQAVAKTGLVE